MHYYFTVDRADFGDDQQKMIIFVNLLGLL